MLRVEADGGEELIGAGEFALILPNRIHAYTTPESSVVHVCIFSEDFVPQFSREIRGKRPASTRFTCRESIVAFVRKELFVSVGTPELYTLKGALYALLGEYLQQTELYTVGGKSERLLDQIVHYIGENFRENITLRTMAEALGYEQHYLSRYFHSFIPMHFSRYVNWYRVDAATELLRNTDLPVTEIAARSGFQSLRSFNRVYLELTGTTPTGRSAGT